MVPMPLLSESVAATIRRVQLLERSLFNMDDELKKASCLQQVTAPFFVALSLTTSLSHYSLLTLSHHLTSPPPHHHLTPPPIYPLTHLPPRRAAASTYCT